MLDNEIKLTREELYERIWSTPTVKLAKEFGISDVALGKICKKFNIPKPPMGYWRRIESGHKVKRPPLPPSKKEMRPFIYISPTLKKETVEIEDSEVIEKIASETLPEKRIQVAETLHGSHPIVRQTRQVYEKAGTDDYGMLWGRRNDIPKLDMRISKQSLHRALRIMDALIKALEERDCSVEVSAGEGRTYVHVGKEKVSIKLTENSLQSKRELTEEKKRKSYYGRSTEWIYTPSEKLTFTIDEYSYAIKKKNWRDKDKKPLEEQLNEIVAGILSTGEILRLERIRKEEEARRQREAMLRRQEEEKRQRIEEARRNRLETESELWVKSQTIHAFVQACESEIIERQGEIIPDSPEAQWLIWAKEHAERINPLKNGYFEKAIKQEEIDEKELNLQKSYLSIYDEW